MTEFFLAIERAEGRTSVHRTRAAARAAGAIFTNAESLLWLRPLIESAQNRHKIGTGFEHESAQNRHKIGTLRARGAKELVPKPIESSSELLRNSSSSSHVASQRGAEREPKAQKLPFDRDLADKRDAILHAVWHELQPYLKRAVTFTLWRQRNNRVAADLAKVGLSPEKVVEAWRIASDRRGDKIRELSLVQKFIEQMASSYEQQVQR